MDDDDDNDDDDDEAELRSLRRATDADVSCCNLTVPGVGITVTVSPPSPDCSPGHLLPPAEHPTRASCHLSVVVVSLKRLSTVSDTVQAVVILVITASDPILLSYPVTLPVPTDPYFTPCTSDPPI